jgi:hypothetical protein
MASKRDCGINYSPDAATFVLDEQPRSSSGVDLQRIDGQCVFEVNLTGLWIDQLAEARASMTCVTLEIKPVPECQ